MAKTRIPESPRSVALSLLILLALGASAGPARAEEPEQTRPVSTVLEARIALNSDSCPTAVEVWLVACGDTIPAMELLLGWDRPDFARFATEKVALPALDTLLPDKSRVGGDSASVSPRIITRPVMRRQGGLIEKWEYAEARGGDGLSVKVTAFASLSGAVKSPPLLPADSGLLFVLPVEMFAVPVHKVDGDSALVQFAPMPTRLSNAKGILLNNIVLRSARMGTSHCWESSKTK